MPGLPAPTAVSAALSWPGSSLYSLIFLLAPSSDGKPARREGLGDLAPVHPFKVHLHGFQNGLGAKRLGEIGVRGCTASCPSVAAPCGKGMHKLTYLCYTRCNLVEKALAKWWAWRGAPLV